MRSGTFLFMVLAIAATIVMLSSSPVSAETFSATIMEDDFEQDIGQPYWYKPDRALWKVRAPGKDSEVGVFQGNLWIRPDHEDWIGVETALDLRTNIFSVSVDWKYSGEGGIPLALTIVTWSGMTEEVAVVFAYSGSGGGWGFMGDPEDHRTWVWSAEETAETGVWYHIYLEFILDSASVEITERGAEDPVYTGTYTDATLSSFTRVRLGSGGSAFSGEADFDNFKLEDRRLPDLRPIIVQVLPVQYMTEGYVHNIVFTDLIDHPSGNPHKVAIESTDPHVAIIQDFNHLVSFIFEKGETRVDVLLEFTDGTMGTSYLVHFEIIPGNDPPEIDIRSPVDGHEYPMNYKILLEIYIEDPDDTEWEITWLVIGTDNVYRRMFIGNITDPLYRFVLADIYVGSYQVTVAVRDLEHNVSATASFSITTDIDGQDSSNDISDSFVCTVCGVLFLVVAIPIIYFWYIRKKQGGTLFTRGGKEHRTGGPLYTPPRAPPTTWRSPQVTTKEVEEPWIPKYKASVEKLPQDVYTYVDSDGRWVKEHGLPTAEPPPEPRRPGRRPPPPPPTEVTGTPKAVPVFTSEPIPIDSDDWRVGSIDEFVDLIPQLPGGFPKPLWGIDWRELGREVVTTSQLRHDGLPVCFVGGKAFHADKRDMDTFMQEVEG